MGSLHWTAAAERLLWFEWSSARPRPVNGISLFRVEFPAMFLRSRSDFHDQNEFTPMRTTGIGRSGLQNDCGAGHAVGRMGICGLCPGMERSADPAGPALVSCEDRAHGECPSSHWAEHRVCRFTETWRSIRRRCGDGASRDDERNAFTSHSRVGTGVLPLDDSRVHRLGVCVDRQRPPFSVASTSQRRITMPLQWTGPASRALVN
jgi:hypothetical protein